MTGLRRLYACHLRVLALVVILSACSSEASQPMSAEATRGRTVATEMGCVVCHSSDGSSGTGPTFAGLYQSEVPLTDGSVVVADEEYLRRSIVDPTADVVEGFAPLMPTNFSERLNEDDVNALVAYIAELR